MEKSIGKLILMTIIISSLSTFSCQNDNKIKSDDHYVLNSFYSGLPDGVEVVRIISKNHPLFLDALNSFALKDVEIESVAEICIYEYTNGVNAVLISDIHENIFAYLVNNRNMAEIESFKARVDFCESRKFTDKTILPFVKINSLNSDLEYEFNPGNMQLKSGDEDATWSKCMEEAMELLYNDWEDDPAGTLVCRVTGPLCAIGAALACLLQQIGIEPAD